MINLLFSIIIAFFLPTGVGFLCLRRLKHDHPSFLGRSLFDPALYALSYLIGMGLVGLLMFLLGIFRIAHTPQNVISALLIISLLCVLKIKKPRSPNRKNPLSPSPITNHPAIQTITWLLLMVLIGLKFGEIYTLALRLPVYAWDSWDTAMFNAKVLFYEHQFLDVHPLLPLPSYPLQIPLLTAWIQMIFGQWSEYLPKILAPNFLLAFCVIQYHFIKQKTNSLIAAASVLLLLSAPFITHHATICYRDLPLMVYLCSGIMMLVLWHASPNSFYLTIASFLILVASATKTEGQVYAVLLVLCFGLSLKFSSFPLKTKITAFLKYALISLSFCIIHFFYKKFLGLSYPFANTLTTSHPSITTIFYRFSQFLIHAHSPAVWGFVWFFFAGCLIFFKKSLNNLTDAWILFFFLFSHFTFNLSILFLLKAPFYLIISDPARLTIHVTPLAIIACVLLLKHSESKT